jgi:flavin reductase (DIM6/NTAB) family NADH-FMN oxidoreductase RutF
MTIESRSFRDTMGCFTTGVTLITARTDEGKPIALTANSFSSVSLNPPLVLWCLDKRSETVPVFDICHHFAVNVLHQNQRDLSSKFATKGDHDCSDIDFETWETGVPIISGALANIECEVSARHDGGDHVIIVGHVLRLRSLDSGEPLLYFRGRYNTLADPGAINKPLDPAVES